jgi:hypothetical protein
MFMQHFVHGLSTDMTSRGVFVQCMVEEGKSILEKILSVTPLEDLQPRALELSEDVPIITYPDASNIPTSPVKAEILQLTALELGSNEDIADPTPSPLSIEEDLFDDDVGDMSKVPTCNIKGLNVKPAKQDLEEFLVAQKTLCDLSAIISKDEMLERLANHSFFCYLDGYSGYHQIPIHPEDLSKTTFTCSYVTFSYR